jgi:hypothetical protein
MRQEKCDSPQKQKARKSASVFIVAATAVSLFTRSVYREHNVAGRSLAETGFSAIYALGRRGYLVGEIGKPFRFNKAWNVDKHFSD